MEKWQLGAVGALVAGFALFGFMAHQSNVNSNPYGGTVTVAGPNGGSGSTQTPFVPPTPSRFDGTTLPPWPSIKQWINTPAPVGLNALKGKPVFLEVFRTGCSHCQDAAPFMAQLHARYAPRGVQFVAIQSPATGKDPENPENDWTKVQAWTKERGYNWPVGFDEKSGWFQGNFGKDVYYPALWVIDPNGKVLTYYTGHDEAKALRLTAILEKVAPGPGDAQKRASDLLDWLTKVTNTQISAQIQDAVKKAVAAYLQQPQMTTPQGNTNSASATPTSAPPR